MFKSGKAKVQADSLKTISLRQPFTETGIAMVMYVESLYSNVQQWTREYRTIIFEESVCSNFVQLMNWYIRQAVVDVDEG